NFPEQLRARILIGCLRVTIFWPSGSITPKPRGWMHRACKIFFDACNSERWACPSTRKALAPAQAAYLKRVGTDRKSTRLNSSHEWISYAVFCLKKKKHMTY